MSGEGPPSGPKPTGQVAEDGDTGRPPPRPGEGSEATQSPRTSSQHPQSKSQPSAVGVSLPSQVQSPMVLSGVPHELTTLLRPEALPENLPPEADVYLKSLQLALQHWQVMAQQSQLPVTPSPQLVAPQAPVLPQEENGIKEKKNAPPMDKEQLETSSKDNAERRGIEQNTPPNDEEQSETSSEEESEEVSTDEVFLDISDISAREDKTLKGLTAPKERVVTLVFHALIPMDIWQWDGEYSSAHIRFGHPDLGNWTKNCGTAVTVVELDGLMTEMRLTIPIDVNLLRRTNGLPYKYAVYSHHRNLLEHLYHAPKPDVSKPHGVKAVATRYLKIPMKKLSAGGVYHQYDTIIYPDQTKKKRRLPRLEGITKTDFKPDSILEMRKKCLEAYLREKQECLTDCSTLIGAINIEECVNDIISIYTCLTCQFVYFPDTEVGRWKQPLQEVMHEWILRTLRTIRRIFEDPSRPPNNSKRLMSAAVLILCIYNVDVDQLEKPDNAVLILKLLTLHPNHKERCCSDFDALVELLPRNVRSELSDATKTVCFSFMKSRGMDDPHWIQALPLHHFLQELSRPFGKLKFKHFMNANLKRSFQHVRDNSSADTRIEKALQCSKDLLAADPYLAGIFVYTCPLSCLDAVFSTPEVRPYLAIFGVAKLIHDKLEPILSSLEEFVQVLDALKYHSVCSRFHHDGEERLLMLSACKQVVKEVQWVTIGDAFQQTPLMKSAASLMLCGLHALIEYDVSKEKEDKEETKRTNKTIDETLVELVQLLSRWIHNRAVSGHFTFSSSRKQRKLKEELKMWDNVLSLDCPSVIAQGWHKAVMEEVRKRTIQVPDQLQRLEIFCGLEPSYHDVIAEALATVATEDIKAMDDRQAIKGVDTILASRKSAHQYVDKMLKKMITDRYPEGTYTSIELTDLLQWKLWPSFIRTYGMKLSQCDVQDNAETMCFMAVAKVEVFCKGIMSGDIRVNDLQLISKNREQMKILIDATSTKSAIMKLLPVGDSIQHAMDRRISELQDVLACKMELGNLYTHIRDSEAGMDALKRDVEMSISTQQISELIKFDGPNKTFPGFVVLQNLEQTVVHQFYVMTGKYSTDTFLRIWRIKMVANQNGGNQPIEEFVHKVWGESYRECRTLLHQYQDLSVRIDQIEEHFQDSSADKIKWELHRLSHGISECEHTADKDNAWIKETVSRIRHHRSLHKYSKAASTILQLKTFLGLRGDFQQVQKVAEVAMEKTKRGRRLKDIDQHVLETGRSLEIIAETKDFVECLDEFVKCEDLIGWLKEQISVKDLKSFVRLALATGAAGEDELAYQKLSDLQLIGTVFGPLIYELTESSGATFLFATLVQVREGFQKQRNLIPTLRDCNKETSWFSDIKKFQGSIETTSFGQMEMITTYGWYMVGNPEMEIASSGREAVSIHLKPNKMYGEPPTASKHKMFCLEELRDLTSRLVLIGGSYKKGREIVDNFVTVFHSVCQVADLLENLQQHGQVAYVGWTLTFPCSLNVTADLLKLSEDMRSDLLKWKESVEVARKSFYELNYFTTVQLLHLRKELGRYKLDYKSIPHSVLMILQSISRNVNSSHVKEALEHVTELLSTVRASTEQLCTSLTSSLYVESGEDTGGISADETSPVPKRATDVDVNHPVIFNLLEQGYDLDKCIEAAMECGYDEATAIDYLSSKENLAMDGGFDHCHGGFRNALEMQSTVNVAYLDLDELGHLLQHLSKLHPATICQSRTPAEDLIKTGCPNLIVTTRGNVMKAVITLYIGDGALPLPTPEEVLLCYATTTSEEVELLWRRAVDDPEHRRIFCLVHAELLSYQVADAAYRKLMEISQTKHGYRLVILCSENGFRRSPLVTKLQRYRRSYPNRYTTEQIQDYLLQHFVRSGVFPGTTASVERSRVRTVRSTRAGMGKSLYIQRLAARLELPHLIVPIHGPNVTPALLIAKLRKCECSNTVCHLDVAPTVLHKVDRVLFSSLVLGGLSDVYGNVWRCNPSHVFAVEALKSERNSEGEGSFILDLLPTINCLSPCEIHRWKYSKVISPNVGLDVEEFETQPFQRVYQYLKRHLNNENLDTFCYTEGTVEDDPSQLWLQTILRCCGIEDPSWSEIRHFVHFLNHQMKACESSIYCQPEVVEEPLQGLKNFAVNFMIEMSKDFATSSLKVEIAQDQPVVLEPLRRYEIRRRWEYCDHPYLFFNQDETSFTFLGFRISSSGDLLHPEKPEVLKRKVASPKLLKGLTLYSVDLNEQWKQWDKKKMVEKLATVIGVVPEKVKDPVHEDVYIFHDPDESYVLTVDNLLKMLAIQMRFRCNIPVIMMGETGCGKTRLIRYMCKLAVQNWQLKNFFVLKVHGGTTEADILKVVSKARTEAAINKHFKVDTVVFFDEVNTTEAINLVKEIMCDCRANGSPMSSDVKFVAACNPYKKHSEEMIAKLETAGLGFFVKNTCDRLGKIPLRQLMYRVLELPPSMRPLVYDFGQLNPEAEGDYIQQIVQHFMSQQDLPPQHQPMNAIAGVLCWCQNYMRDRKDECSFVSLRDVERAMIVFNYFFEKMTLLEQYIEEKRSNHHRMKQGSAMKKVFALFTPDKLLQPLDRVVRAFILALSVCYCARLQKRSEFQEALVQQLHKSKVLRLPGGKDEFVNEIYWAQDVFLDNMKLGPCIARNTALRENVFMMVVCIELRIPLFVIGKPGTSKSLAKTIVHDSMQGRNSHSSLLKNMKEVHMFSYQCSQQSTAESIIQIFNSARTFQDQQNTEHSVSVVVLDEVGLAEDSPHLPLKALHPLLDDGTAGADDSDEVIDRKKRVAFIGISNWALDPAKMNRGIMVTRTDLDADELVLSARGICLNEEHDRVRARLELYFAPLALAYQDITGRQKKEFYGLRDFYSLIKMLYYMCKASDCPPTWQQFLHAIRRNFEGFGKLDTLPFFMDRIYIHEHTAIDTLPELSPVIIPDCSDLGIITASLDIQDKAWQGESRYLLFLTENFAALTAALHILHGVGAKKDERAQNSEPEVLFGSSFPRDKEFAQVCRNINQVKLCMETGRTVILLNLENLYESLYDLLNQYYTEHGGNKFVDLGLRNHRMSCKVHESFKVIIIAEEETVYDNFPTPLINRLEKHRVVMETILDGMQKGVLHDFLNWIEQLTVVLNSDGSLSGLTFTKADAFVGYHKDTPAAVVYQATELLKDELEQGVLTLEEKQQKILKRTKFLILQTATPDALIRLRRTKLSEEQVTDCLQYYFESQTHGSLNEFLVEHLLVKSPKDGIFVQVTTHGILPTSWDYQKLEECLNTNISCFYLHQFDTEMDFTNTISSTIREGSKRKGLLLVIQCDASFTSGNLIACARYRVYDTVKEQTHKTGRQGAGVHILLVIHVPRNVQCSSFTGFQVKPWISYHIDDLGVPHAEVLVNFSYKDQHGSEKISNLFYNNSHRLHGLVQAAACKMYDYGDTNRATDRLKILLHLIPDMSISADCAQEKPPFYTTVIKIIHLVLKERDEVVYSDHDWVLDAALNQRELQTEGTLQAALCTKADGVVSSVFSEIIGFVDCNYNLDLIHQNEPLTSIHKLWYSLFDNQFICKITFEVLFPEKIPREHIPGVGGHHRDNVFHCKFPFSWLVKDALDSLLSQALQVKGEAQRDLQAHLYGMVCDNPLGESFSSVEASDEEARALTDAYLHDFLRMVYKSKHREGIEYELLSKALHNVACHPDLAMSESHNVLIGNIVAIHIAYWMSEQKLLWFGQLVALNPSILKELVVEQNTRGVMILHIEAARKTLQFIGIPMEASPSKTLEWSHHILQSQNAIESALSLQVESEEDQSFLKETRQKWHQLQVLQLFVEHITSKYCKMFPYLQKLIEGLSAVSDFASVAFFKTVIDILDDLCKHHARKHPNLRNRCCAFLMEVTSNLSSSCGTPQPAIVDKLLNIAFTKRSGATSPVLSFLEGQKEEILLRGFLFQLLLKHDFKTCEEYLQKHLQTFQGRDRDDHTVYLQCVQGFEDSQHQQVCDLPVVAKIQLGVKNLRSSYKILREFRTVSLSPSLGHLKAVANVRCALCVVAHRLADLVNEDGTLDMERLSESSDHVLYEAAKDVCTDQSINYRHTGPGIFLLKQIFKQYGSTCLKALATNQFLSWVLPQHLEPSEDEARELDPFIIYGDGYKKLRTAVTAAANGYGFENMNRVLMGTMPKSSGLLLLSLYSVVTMTYTKQHHICEEILQAMSMYVKEVNDLTPKAIEVGCKLLMNSTGPLHSPLRISPSQPNEHRILARVVIHTISVFIARNCHILQPFLLLMQQPSAMKKAYMPTMPEDHFLDARRALIGAGSFYQCPRGHPYIVTECGRPVQKFICQECGAQIGGTVHKLRRGNKPARSEDLTQTGYLLADPKSRSEHPFPERSLSPACCAIIRLLMHSVLLWASYSDDQTIAQATQELVEKPKLPLTKIPEFFWEHLNCDIKVLQKAIGKGIDDTALLVHRILCRIHLLNISDDEDGKFDGVAKLRSKEHRAQWEDAFNNHYLKPILKQLDIELKKTVDLIAEDAKHDVDQLFLVVNEKVPVKKGDIVAHLWSYRDKVSPEHLVQVLQQRDADSVCPILREFMTKEPSLRATKYLPEITVLQKCLYDKYHYRLDVRDAERKTIKQFLDEIKETNLILHKKYQRMINGLRKAWKLVRHKVAEHAASHFGVLQEDLPPDMTSETSLVYLIPTTSGRGVCTTALVYYLVQTHNGFIEKCRQIVTERQNITAPWMELQVPITHLSRCHLTDHEEQLHPIILSYCKCSLRAGEGHVVHYDLPGLDRHILKKFVLGKPTILLDIPQVAYKKDVYTTIKLNAVRQNVPQVPMPAEMRDKICKDAQWRLPEIKKAIGMVDVVLGFLSSGAGNPKEPLKLYVTKTLQMRRDAVLEKLPDCLLEHAISLWKILSVEMARRLTVLQQEPFDLDEELLNQRLEEQQMRELTDVLNHFDLGQLLESLLEFILIYVKHCPETELDWAIVDTLEAFLDHSGLPQIPHFNGEFPRSITVGQTIHTWKHIAETQEKLLKQTQ